MNLRTLRHFIQPAPRHRLVGGLGRSAQLPAGAGHAAENAPLVAQTRVQELVEAEFSRLLRKGVLSFGSAASDVLD